MTALPGDSYWSVEGEVLAGPYPGAASADEARTKLGELLDLGVGLFLDLTEEDEGPPLAPYARLLRDVAAKRDVSVTYSRMAIRDVDIPSEWQMRAILDVIASARTAGELVYVHCWGGVGRTGTVVGCMLREAGLPASEVLGEIARARAETARAGRESPETEAQRQFVTEWPPAQEVQLWLDDDLETRAAPPGWTHVTTAPEAIRTLDSGTVVELSLDHDLGNDELYGRGVDVVDWLAEQQEVHGRALWPREGIAIHSANPHGRETMARTIERYAEPTHRSVTRGGTLRLEFPD